jgi:hypothetical protein
MLADDCIARIDFNGLELAVCRQSEPENYDLSGMWPARLLEDIAVQGRE